jgi:hypothetical protein
MVLRSAQVFDVVCDEGRHIGSGPHRRHGLDGYRVHFHDEV